MSGFCGMFLFSALSGVWASGLPVGPIRCCPLDTEGGLTPVLCTWEGSMLGVSEVRAVS